MAEQILDSRLFRKWEGDRHLCAKAPFGPPAAAKVPVPFASRERELATVIRDADSADRVVFRVGPVTSDSHKGWIGGRGGRSDMNVPGFRLHPLKGESRGRWSVWVNGSWRLTFEFRDRHAPILDYEDYH